VRIGPEDAVDLRGLPRGEILVRVEAVAARQEALSPQDLVQARDAPRKAVPRVEERGIRVGVGTGRRPVRKNQVPPAREFRNWRRYRMAPLPDAEGERYDAGGMRTVGQ
jgi:hypothetical protein